MRILGPSLVVLMFACACDKDKPKPDPEAKKTEATPVPSGLVFNDFLPPTGAATGLGVRDSGIEGGLAEVAGGGGEPGAQGATEEGQTAKLKVIDPGSEPRAAR